MASNDVGINPGGELYYSSGKPGVSPLVLSLQDIERIAEVAHKGQVDKLGVAYIEHPRAVARLVEEVPAYQELSLGQQWLALASAFLHDVLEDTAFRPVDLRNLGVAMEVLYVVRDLTKKPNVPNEEYYARVSKNEVARVTKIADMAHNADFDRLSQLDEATAVRLRKKYSHGILLLTKTHPKDLEWFHGQVKFTTI